MADNDTCGATNRNGEPCGLSAGWGTDHTGEGRCKFHGGASPGAPKGNDNAVTVGAWAEDFYEGFLTEAEKKRVKESVDILGTHAGTQEIGRHAASVCLEQFRRTGDERFIRRFESICDKFGIAPADEVSIDMEMGEAMWSNLTGYYEGDG